MRRRERCSRHAFDNPVERKLQLVRLVQSDFEHARYDLRSTSKTLRRRIDDGQAVGRNAAGLQHFVNDLRRRRTRAFQYQNGFFRGVSILEHFEQWLHSGKRPGRTGTKSKKRVGAFSVSETPTGILTCQARDYRIARMDL